MRWSIDNEDSLRVAYARGDSYGVIARDIGGMTRSAVAGKVKRLGLTRDPRPRRAVLPNPTRRTGPYPRVRAAYVPVAPRPAPRVVIPGRECDVWALDKTRCRFPHGEPRKEGFHFCGQPPQKDSPYCPDHHAITHRKTPGLI